uniref:Uncharacterized protein n=1 Tax=Fibrocapsa japonica TaxID=94617 RepID=A0A7S2XXA8_9STRA|mmetsp:Transcript_21624/g.31365  ORF Transcript_21624/g.31365 Transcript_21624/m.31365 type:complete len:296 (+) Transcript_21624:213-1100(+)
MNAHTPLRNLSGNHGKGLVVAFGREDRPQELSTHYGFANFATADEYFAQHPHLWPTEIPPSVERDERLHAPVAACVVYGTPQNWERDIQILLDLLRSNGRPGHPAPPGKQVVSLYVSGPDLLYPWDHCEPRLGDGAFLSCLTHLYNITVRATISASSANNMEDEYDHTADAVGGMTCNKMPDVPGMPELEVIQLGKPHPETYKYARGLIQSRAQDMGYSSVQRVYAIGDNPQSDIRGANGAGDDWISVLVHTGIFRPEQEGCDNCPENPAQIVAKDVSEAVSLILAREGYPQEDS